MKKQFKLMALASVTMLFAACSQENLLSPQEQLAQSPENNAIQFGTYVTKSGTRAGLAGVMNDTELKKSDGNGGGFGLFAYHTDNATYTATAAPNFMWNQGVFYNEGTSSWEYTPVKYWPNETSTTNNEQQSSKSAGVDRLTFFAYAPYVTLADISSDGSKGITSITANNVNGDPKIGYTVATDPDEAVDLLWGIIPSSVTEWANVTGTAMTSSTDPAFISGKPYLNLLKPNTTQKVNFLFRHALAKLTVGVQVVNNLVDPSSSSLETANTKVFIKSITITSKTEDGFGTSGTLNLNNTTADVPLWETVNKTTATALTADESGEIAPALFWTSPTTVETRNTQFGLTGVTETLTNIVTGTTPAATDKGWMLVPTGTANNFTVNIDYFVMTKDTNLNGGYSIVENNITKDVTIASTGFAGGNNYQIKLLLGLTSVKVEGSVQAWTDGTATEVDLPMNVN